MELDKERYLKREVTKGSERSDLIGQFLEKINEQRRLENGKEYKASYIAFRLSHIPTADLYFFYKKCEQSSNFNRMFFGLLK